VKAACYFCDKLPLSHVTPIGKQPICVDCVARFLKDAR
jgi:hypothetical protein